MCRSTSAKHGRALTPGWPPAVLLAKGKAVRFAVSMMPAMWAPNGAAQGPHFDGDPPSCKEQSAIVKTIAGIMAGRGAPRRIRKHSTLRRSARNEARARRKTRSNARPANFS